MSKKKTVKLIKPFLGFMNRAKLYRETREKNKVTQTELAEQLGGMHSQFVSNWERALCDVPNHSIKKFVYTHGIPKDRFKMAMMQDHGAFVEDYVNWVYSK